MDTLSRLLGSGIAAAGTLFQLAVIAATVPEWSECGGRSACVGGHIDWRVEVNIWAPFITNTSDGTGRPEREPQCPAPRGRSDRHGLAAAPLPDGFDPHAYGERELYACVLVGRDGDVLAARMLRGTGEAARDSILVTTIRRGWRFGPDSGDPRPRSWQRVRLSSGPGGVAI